MASRSPERSATASASSRKLAPWLGSPDSSSMSALSAVSRAFHPSLSPARLSAARTVREASGTRPVRINV